MKVWSLLRFNRIMPYSGSSTTSPQTFKGDSTYMSAWQISFLNRSDFFRTMGFEGAEGMTAGELDERIFDKDEYVLTANTSEFFLHPERHGTTTALPNIGWRV